MADLELHPMKSFHAVLISFLYLFNGMQVASAATAEDAVTRGKTVFMRNQCYSCHGTEGQGGERGAGPRIAPQPFPFVAFEMQLRTPRGVMPRYPVQSIDVAQLKDLHAYLESIPVGTAPTQIPLLHNAMRTP
jgi:mono/diheme cytochrome c family protein